MSIEFMRKVDSCPKCGSMNISLDVSTGKIDCANCTETGFQSSKLDFMEVQEKMKEEEFGELHKRQQLGDMIFINNGHPFKDNMSDGQNRLPNV